MQFKRILLFSSMAAFATAAPVQAQSHQLVQRDYPTVEKVFNSIMAEIDKMVAVVEQFTGSPDQLVSVQTSSGDIIKIMDAGTEEIKASATMGLMDAIKIIGPTGVLASKVESIITALNSKKAKFDELNVSAVVLEQLKSQQVSAAKLSDVILANLPMPSILGMIAGPIAKQVTDKLDAGVKAWS